MSSMHEELAMSQAFATPQEEALLSLIRTCEMIQAPIDALFRQHNITSAQYNVLRILRGSGDEGRTCGEIDRRLLRRGPDVTRLIDRMKQCGLVTRQRSREDRRVVRVVLTAEGRTIVDALDAPVSDVQSKMMANLSDDQCDTISSLLTTVREAVKEIQNNIP